MQRASLSLVAGLALSSLAATPDAQGAVHHVDATGGGDFTTIQAAVDAAVDSDLVLVRSGTYGSFTIDGESLIVAADAGASVLVTGTATVANLGPSQSATLMGLELEAVNACPGVPALVHVTSCAGSVFLESLHLRCQGLFSSVLVGAGVDALRVESSDAVSVVDSILDGDPMEYLGCTGEGRRALVAVDSNVYLHGSTLNGGQGVGASFTLFGLFPSEPGDEALALTGGAVFAVDSTIAGGRGGNGAVDPFGSGCAVGSDGAAGARLEQGGAAPVLRRLGSTVGAGPPGNDAGCGTGVAGVDLNVVAGSVVPIPGTGRPLVSTDVAPDQTTATIALRGNPSEMAWLGLSLAPSTPLAIEPTLTGIVSPLIPWLDFFFVGVLDANGELDLQFPIDDFGFPYLPVYHQAYLSPDLIRFKASYPQLMLVLDDV